MPGHVLGLAGREADLADLALRRSSDALPGRERPRFTVPNAEPLDQPRAHRECGVERHLLRGDQTDEHLPRIRDERRPVGAQRLRQGGQRRLGRRPGPEAPELERRPEEPRRLAEDVVVGRLDLDAAGRRLEPHLAARDDAVQPAVVPGVGAVDAVGAEALGRGEEVVWLRQREEGDAAIVRTRLWIYGSSASRMSCRSSKGSNATPCAVRY